MEEISANISEVIGLLVWSDWLTMITLIVFIGLGVKRGLVIGVVDLLFLIVATFGAWLFYEKLSHLAMIRWVLDAQQSQLAFAFGIIFVAVLAVKKTMYQLINIPSGINPCTLNKTFALLTLFTLNLFVSWHYTNSLNSFELIAHFVSNTALQVELSFMLVFVTIAGVALLLKHTFNISINSHEPCALESFFRTLLKGLHSISAAFNMCEANTPMRKTGGAVIGLIKGFVFIVMLVLVLQNVDFISKQVFWTESQSLFKVLQDITANIKVELADYLLFIKKY